MAKTGMTGRASVNVNMMGGLQGLTSRPGQQNALNSSMNKADDFKLRMQKLKSDKSGMALGSGLSNQDALNAVNNKVMGAGIGRQSVMQPQSNQGQGLNTSFSELNKNISDKWGALKNKGNATGRPQLNQTISGAGVGAMGTNQLNTSNNKFQSRLQGSFANRMQPSNGLAAKAGGMSTSNNA